MTNENIEKLRLIRRRINIIKGQLDGLLGMIERDEYCVDLLTQSSAIQSSLKSLDSLILERHLHRHVKTQFIEEPDRAIEELLKVFKRSSKTDTSIETNGRDYYLTKKYNGSFESGVESITESLKKEGFGVLTNIDVKKTLKEKIDANFSKYVILGACNPKNAHNALLSEMEVGLLLPCNVVVYEENDNTYISVIRPTTLFVVSDNKALLNIAKEIEAKLLSALNNAVKDIET